MIPRVLKRLTALGAAILVLVPTTSAAAAGLTRAEARLLRDLNRVRAAHGLTPLRYDPHLQRAARAHSRDMLRHADLPARRVRRTHGAVRRERLVDRREPRVGQRPARLGELDRARWLASPEHRANLLRPGFTRIGIGDLVGPFLGYDSTHVVTADFAG